MGPLPKSVAFIKGQLESGDSTGYRHWQLLFWFKSTQRLSAIRKLYTGHFSLSRSEAAEAYVWKDDTCVAGTKFSLGSKPLQRSSKTDWDSIRQLAVRGDLDGIPSDIYIRCYHQLKSISADHIQPAPMVRRCLVFWGPTGTGKSRKAWEDAGMDAYCKDPRTKWWCGYGSQKNVVIDEFRGAIDVSHLLRWLDRYPVIVEKKGTAVPLVAETFWITSNLPPTSWYPDLDPETTAALLRRLTVTQFHNPL